MRKKVVVIGVASGVGAADPGCQDGPEVLGQLGFFRDLQRADANFFVDDVIHLAPITPGCAVERVAEVGSRVASRVMGAMRAGHFPLVIGGDHSCAIGTWSGVQASMPAPARLGLIWLDAHMDSHTFSTSPSRAINGMALACLLGHGDRRLTGVVTTGPKLDPANVCLIGVRSFEPEEALLLHRLGVRVYLMAEIRAKGLAQVFAEARARVTAGTTGYGVSLDLDVLEPAEEPGVGTPVPGGILCHDLADALRTLHGDTRLMALEIVEYNPWRDRQFVTARAVQELCLSVTEGA